MELSVHGKQIDIGDALRAHVESRIEEINQKYFNHAAYATVTFSREGHGHQDTKVHISIHLGGSITAIADTQAADPYAAFDMAADKVGKQLRRYKRKLRDHHERLEQTPEGEITKARDYVIAGAPEDESGHSEDEDAGAAGSDEPVIIAEMTTDIQTMSVSEAVMRMDLAGQAAFLFRNANHNGLNMIYRRPDGNIGWVDPADAADERAAKSA